jgi:ribosomal-protein-serine acetyltransferase
VSAPHPLRTPLPRLVVGDRLRLELWREESVEEVTRLIERSRPVLSEFLPWATAPVTVEDERLIQRDAELQWQEGQLVAWTIVEDEEIKGALGMHRRGGPDEIEIGYWLDVDATGRGLMTAACEMATEVAFMSDQVNVVEIIHDKDNARSGAVPARLGFAKVAAFTAPPNALLESGIKVRWQMTRRNWTYRATAATVRYVE